MAGASSGSCRYYSSRCSLPSAWEARASLRSDQLAMSFLKVEGPRVRYVGPGEDDSHAAAIRANLPVPADCSLYYFEVRVLDRGQDGFIGVGFCTSDVRLARLPGWEGHSYGYHGDDGHAFAGQGVGRPYGPPYGTGDVIGALYDKVERTISYFKNGRPLGVAFREVQEATPLYPCVGMRTRGEALAANFGTGAEPFRTDLHALQADQQARVLASVRKTQLPLLSSRGTALLPQLMYDYLIHQRYGSTAALLARDLLRPSSSTSSSCRDPSSSPLSPSPSSSHSPSTMAPGKPKQPLQQLSQQQQHESYNNDRYDDEQQVLADIAVRQQVYDLVVGGRIDEALGVLREKYPPELLLERPSVDFRLRLQKFVEMVAAANSGSSGNRASGTAAGASAPAEVGKAGASSGSGSGGAQCGKAGESEVGGSTTSKAGGEPVAAREAGLAASPPGGGDMMHVDDPEEEEGSEGMLKGEETASESTAAPAAVAAPAAAPPPPPPPPPSTREILEYGSCEVMMRCRTEADRELLTDALSLLAFHHPASSPAGYLLRPGHRTSLAEELNGAMLSCRGRPATAPLTQLYRQLGALLGELKGRDEPQVLALPDLRSLLLEPPAPPQHHQQQPPASTGEGGGGRSGWEEQQPQPEQQQQQQPPPAAIAISSLASLAAALGRTGV
ncbi:hypothetical protein Agub_g13606, partial [Astrephomene gubernaculifera]